MLFIGIGPDAAVVNTWEAWSASVQDIDFDPFRVKYLPIAGGAPEGADGAALLGGLRLRGGNTTVTWDVREGDWPVVLMNADGSRDVVADIDLGAKLSFLLWVALGLLLGGVLVVAGSTALIVLAARTRKPPPEPPVPPSAGRGSRKYAGTRASDRSTEEPPARLNAVASSST